MSKPSSTIIAEALAELGGEMRHFKEELILALDKPTDFADYAFSADTLEGKTPAQIQQLLLDEVTKHTSKLGVNVHGINGNQVGSYTGQEFEDRLDMLMDTESGVPLDFYGDREFLPPSITGSFESGSNTTPWGMVAMMLEDNGTLMVLRTGTDGDTAGLFYSYLRNAQTETDIGNIIMSNVQYEPAFIPAGMKCFAIVHGSQDIIVGIVVDKVTLARTGYFVSVTNNTMDHTKHTGVFVPNGSIFDVHFHPTYTSSMVGGVTGYIKNGWCYFLCNLDVVNQFGWRVWRIPVANLIAGVWGGVEQVTGWTINRGGAGVVSRSDLVLFDNVQDAFAQIGSAHINQLPAAASPGVFPMVREDGRVIVMQQKYWQYIPTDQRAQQQGFVGSWTIEIPDNKVIDCAKYHNQKVVSTYVSGVGFSIGVCPAWVGDSYNAWMRYAGGQACGSWYTTKFNQMWMWGTTTYYSSRVLYRLPGPDINQDPLDYFQMRTGVGPGVQGVNISGRHGSALTVAFHCIGNIGDFQLTAKNYIKPLGKPYGDYAVRALITGEPTYQYSSVSGKYAYRGFAPTIQRYTFEELGASDITAIVMLNEGHSGAEWQSHGRFTKNTGQWIKAGKINPDLTVSGAIITTGDCMESINQQIYNDLVSKGVTFYGDRNTSMCFELNVPQMYTDMPPFVFGTYISADQSITNFVYSCAITVGNRQSISAVAIQPSTLARAIGWQGTGLSVTPMENCGQNAIRRVNGGFVVGVVPASIITVVGDAETSINLLTYNGTWAFRGTPVWNHWQVAPMGWINFPSRGLYWGLCSEFIRGEIDCGSKLLGVLMATTDMNTRTMDNGYPLFQDGNNCIVLVSQKTVSAWTIYFSDPTPAMLDGTYQVIANTTYELNPAVDANKTFYMWIVKVNGVLSYRVVAQSAAAPTGVQASLYLGYLTTTADGIQKVVAEKRVAVGGNVLARASQGSGIPLTSGTPNAYGRLNWK
jgi:hypothetical protein